MKAVVWGHYALAMSLWLVLGHSLTVFAQSDTARKAAKNTVDVTHKVGGLHLSGKSASLTQTITSGELLKAACCNLSESFESHAGVDVAYSDALTGTRQIQMLGLSGIATAIQSENIPILRGIGSLYGLTSLPGTWLQSIQVTKGPGTVLSGYEGLSGLVNLEQIKPDATQGYLLNLFANHLGRYEANVQGNSVLKNGSWSIGAGYHYDQWLKPFDRNKDGFMDMPMNQTHAAFVRAKYNGNLWKWQAGIQGASEIRWAGQNEYMPEMKGHRNHYGFQMDNQQWHVWQKLGRVFPSKPWRGLGWITSYQWQDLHSYFGTQPFHGKQQSLSSQLIYQSIIQDTRHKINLAANVLGDVVNEHLAQTTDTLHFDRREWVAGLAVEHTWQPNERWLLVSGIRADANQLFGLSASPRIHGKYDITPLSSLRFSIGRAQRTAFALTDNLNYLVSNRQFTLPARPAIQAGYGFRPEVIWNGGLSYNREMELLGRKLEWTTDLFYTWYQRQTILDLENPHFIRLYQGQGSTRAWAFQTELAWKLHRRWDVRLAGRYYDVRTRYEAGWLERPFTARFRGFVTSSYSTRNGWKLDGTINWMGDKRMPNTTGLPDGLSWWTRSPSYFLANAQVTKVFSPQFELYLGGENLLDFRQERLLLDPQNPFGNHFDATLVWGPPVGRVIYMGLRLKMR